MIPAFIDKALLPHKSGVYLFKDDRGSIIYVGKAIDLYSRVSSYFSGPQYPKVAAMVEKARNLQTIIVESELEALILEANLIKKYLPLYNIKLTDDKDYLYIKVTAAPFPQIVTARKQQLSDAKDFFGPFPSSRTVRETLKKIRRIFPWCSNPPKAENSKLKPCFYYHLGQCSGACVGKISQKDYNLIIKLFIKLMKGQTSDLLCELNKAMEDSAKNLEYEAAESYKKIITGLTYLLQPNRVEIYLENPNYLEEQTEKSLRSLQVDLNLPTLPERIECYDISNFGGVDATGSMVVITSGEIDKSQYRKFKIKISGKANDVGMHKEMMARRLKHPEWQKPDLIIIDGGRGQVRAVKEILDQSLWKGIPVFGLAKRLEWLYHPENYIVKLPKSSLSLRLLQKLRDEAHRFALTYHRKLRARKMYNG